MSNLEDVLKDLREWNEWARTPGVSVPDVPNHQILAAVVTNQAGYAPATEDVRAGGSGLIASYAYGEVEHIPGVSFFAEEDKLKFPVTLPDRLATMGIWSSLKNAAKKAWRAVKGAVRWGVKIWATIFMGFVNIWDLALGFLNWPPKKLTLHIVILSKYDPIEATIVPMCQPSELQPSIDQAERILRERFNVRLRPYASQYAQILDEVAPEAALKPSCCGADPFGQEFLEQGEFYAGQTAGWVAIPTSLRFPITAFVVEDVQCKSGCGIGPLTDYLVIDMDGVNSTGPLLNNSTLMHEIGHCCHLWHVGTQTNLMYKTTDRGDDTKWWQRNLFRNSRHVTYW